GEKGLKERFTGSDLYPILTARALENNWSCFFFGHSRKILDFISVRHPRLKIAGVHEGYNFKTNEVIDKINKVNPDILIIGLSCPIQEQWISENKDKIKFKVALLVGDGIKIFAGKKIRGPVILRNMGLEWVTRYFTNPVQNFRKYVFGVPLFILRTLNAKIKSK
ncbi:MAG: WecB/TagA/CpsF family glycosyltransferase, partial [bacterium]